MVKLIRSTKLAVKDLRNHCSWHVTCWAFWNRPQPDSYWGALRSRLALLYISPQDDDPPSSIEKKSVLESQQIKILHQSCRVTEARISVLAQHTTWTDQSFHFTRIRRSNWWHKLGKTFFRLPAVASWWHHSEFIRRLNVWALMVLNSDGFNILWSRKYKWLALIHC